MLALPCALANLRIAGTHHSFAGLIVFPPQDQTYECAETDRAENERARDGNRDPGEDHETNGYNRASLSAGDAQAAVLSDEAWLAGRHGSLPPRTGNATLSFDADRGQSCLWVEAGRGCRAWLARCREQRRRAEGGHDRRH